MKDINHMSKSELIDCLNETENEIGEIKKYMRETLNRTSRMVYHLRDREDRRDAIKLRLEELSA